LVPLEGAAELAVEDKAAGILRKRKMKDMTAKTEGLEMCAVVDPCFL
jgi:hypothetical protein